MTWRAISMQGKILGARVDRYAAESEGCRR
jgi:hypothetical protein